MKLFILIDMKKKINIEIDANLFVYDIKKYIEECSNIPISKQLIKYKNDILLDSYKITNFIKNKDTLYLITKL